MKFVPDDLAKFWDVVAYIGSVFSYNLMPLSPFGNQVPYSCGVWYNHCHTQSVVRSVAPIKGAAILACELMPLPVFTSASAA